jgi:uncharacterized protein involved in tolerance to divalent cations
MSTQFLSTTSLAKRWDCSTDLVRKLVREGAIKAISLTSGKRSFYRFELSVVEQHEAKMSRGQRSSVRTVSASAVRFAKGANQ